MKFKSAESVTSNSLNLDMANLCLDDKLQTFLKTKCAYVTHMSPSV